MGLFGGSFEDVKYSYWAAGIVVVLVIAAGVYWFGFKSAPVASFGNDSSGVMYFYSDSCEWCVKEKLVLESLAGEGFRVRLMNTGLNASLIDAYSIQGTPTFVSGNESLVGFKEIGVLRPWLLSHGAKIA